MEITKTNPTILKFKHINYGIKFSLSREIHNTIYIEAIINLD